MQRIISDGFVFYRLKDPNLLVVIGKQSMELREPYLLHSTETFNTSSVNLVDIVLTVKQDQFHLCKLPLFLINFCLERYLKRGQI